jgi:hypothetical protein
MGLSDAHLTLAGQAFAGGGAAPEKRESVSSFELG